MSATCYLCDKVFDNLTTIKHDEHVIQNAIGGALVSGEILCKKCGGKLGENVDAPFAKALSPLTTLLQAPRDRGDHSKVDTDIVANTLDAKSLEEEKFILKNDFSVVPTRPLCLKSQPKKTITVLAATIKQAKQYARSAHIRSQLVNGYKLEVSDNAAAYAETLLVKASPNSIEVLRGILKIAIGYASHNGVTRESFAHLIEHDDLTDSEMVVRSSVFNYYPTNDIERLFETEKHTHEDWYPTHQLYLFSQGSHLYCYVELFGTIQKYVQLSRKYSGPPLVKKFVQKAEKWQFDERLFTAGSPKDLHLLAGQFDVQTSGLSWHEIQAKILQRARSRSYSLEPDKTVEKADDIARRLALFSFVKNGQEFEIVRSLFDKANTAKGQLGFRLLDDLSKDPMIAMRFVRQKSDDFRMGSVRDSYPEKARQVDSQDLDKYVAYKFYELLCAKGRESILQYQII
ncbi:HNH endonuclease [Salinisphaera hydrothermalis]|uniref:HNH endonuclease n=1 Tax=Salinisphaera hydrothermalis TaxID=563188 RepID=UPI0033418055